MGRDHGKKKKKKGALRRWPPVRKAKASLGRFRRVFRGRWPARALMQVLHAIKHETQTDYKCTFCKHRLDLGRGGAPGLPVCVEPVTMF